MLITTVVSASEKQTIFENSYGKLILDIVSSNEYNLVFSKESTEKVLQKYMYQSGGVMYMYDKIVIFSGIYNLGLYLYDIEKDEIILLNTNKYKGPSADVYYNSYEVKDNKLLIESGIDGIGTSKFCTYDLPKLLNLTKQYDLSSQLKSSFDHDTANLYEFTNKHEVSFCSFDMAGDHQEAEFTTDDKIRFKVSDTPTGGDEITEGNIYETNIENQESEIVGVITGDIEIVELFIDLPEGHDLYHTVYKAKADGWLNGYPDSSIRLDNSINRAEFAKLVIKAFQEEEIKIPAGTDYIFPDVAASEWYASTLYTATKLGLMSGYPDGNAKPEQTIIKVEALKIVLELLGEEYSKSNSQYQDTESNQWYSPYTDFAKRFGLFDVEQDKLFPAKNITRGEAIELISKVLDIHNQ